MPCYWAGQGSEHVVRGEPTQMIQRHAVEILACALLVSSCAGDSGPSRAEFTQAANEICLAEQERGEAVIAESFPDPENPTPRQVIFAVQAYSRIRRETAARVAELDQPADDGDVIQDWVDETTAAVDRIETIPSAQEALAALEASGTPADPFYEANRTAQEYGLDDCVV